MTFDDQADLRREFERVSELLYAASPWSKLQQIQARFDSRLRELYKKHFPRKIFQDHALDAMFAALVQLEPQLVQERDDAKAEGKKVSDAYYEEKEFLDPWLEEIARQCIIRPSRTTWSQFKTVPSYRYDSTGSGNMYAQGQAQHFVEALQALDLEARITTHDMTRTMRDYTVHVRVAESERDILLRKPLMSLRDAVKWYLAHGLNPRVYFAGLPHGYEERVGLGPAGQERTPP